MRTAVFHVVLLFDVLVVSLPVAAQTWPISPQTDDHPIGTTLGEYVEYESQPSFHAGIDILATPMYTSSGGVDPSAEWVRVAVAGVVICLENHGAASLENQTVILGDDLRTYRYLHLQGGDFGFDPHYVDRYRNYKKGNYAKAHVKAGDRIARVARWETSSFTSDFHHLHYEVQNGGAFLNPFDVDGDGVKDMVPSPDPAPPEIEGIFFAKDNTDPWQAFTPEPAPDSPCTVVSGQVDVLVKARDRDDAGSARIGAATLWVHKVCWRACPETDPNCPWQDTYVFDAVPGGWALDSPQIKAYYSRRSPWTTDWDYDKKTFLYGIVTNFSGGAPDAGGTWDTTPAGVPDGSYSVSVELTDFAGNVSVYSRRVCVENGTGCTTELTIRDAEDDSGAVPYEGSDRWKSPDIIVNPGTASENIEINIGAANRVDVRVWNLGSCDIPSGTTYEILLAWIDLSAAEAGLFGLIERQTVTVPAGGWPAGTSQVTTFNWTPMADEVPTGSVILYSRVTTANDVAADDDWAIRTIEFD